MLLSGLVFFVGVPFLVFLLFLIVLRRMWFPGRECSESCQVWLLQFKIGSVSWYRELTLRDGGGLEGKGEGVHSSEKIRVLPQDLLHLLRIGAKRVRRGPC